jgi:hypothetical protein
MCALKTTKENKITKDNVGRRDEKTHPKCQINRGHLSNRWLKYLFVCLLVSLPDIV